MKYCTKCGAEIMDEAIICPKCGCATGYQPEKNTKTSNEESSLKTVAKIFMILSCVVCAFAIIPLCWMIPMTVTYCNKINHHEPVSVGFKVCTLLFVNQIAGILMLCDTEN